MAAVLVDTSVWIDYLRVGSSDAADALETLLKNNQAVLCGVTEAELLQGLRLDERGKVGLLLAALPYLETDRDDFRDAGELLRTLRSRGVTLPVTDGLIAVLCLRYNLPILTLDKHFDSVPGLKLHKT